MQNLFLFTNLYILYEKIIIHSFKIEINSFLSKNRSNHQSYANPLQSYGLFKKAILFALENQKLQVKLSNQDKSVSDIVAPKHLKTNSIQFVR